MKLQIKLIVAFAIFATLPTAFFGVYQSITGYNSLTATAVKKVSESAETLSSDISEYFNAGVNDIEFLAQMAEIKNLIDGIEMEDMDEIEFWSQALTNAVKAFADNRDDFHDIRFTTAEGKTIVRVLHERGEAAVSSKEFGTIGDVDSGGSGGSGYQDVMNNGTPLGLFSKNKGSLSLWLHYPVGNPVAGVISARIHLDKFRALCADPKVFIFSDKTDELNTIDSGDSDFAPTPDILANIKSDTNSMTGRYKEQIFAYEKFTPLKWMPDYQWIMFKFFPKKEIMAPVYSLMQNVVIICFAAIFISVLCGFFVGKSIVRPVKLVVDSLGELAEGEADLTKRLKIMTKDEIGDLAHCFNLFVDKLNRLIKSISKETNVIDTSSSQQSQLAGQISHGIIQTSERTSNVSAAAEKLSFAMTSISAAMEQASTSINLMANSSEEITVTVDGIAQNSAQARNITNEAVSQSKNALHTVDELNLAAGEIGKVTEEIADISSQTDLLALNATIEAARAGEAGKGFAVVAGEIKELSGQTAQATLSIKNQVNGIQESTSKTVAVINNITDVIGQVDKIVTIISAAIDEQSSAVKDISTNISQASLGIKEVNENVAESSTVSAEISNDIAQVSDLVVNMSERCSVIDSGAGNLSKMAENLSDLVKRFKI